MSDQKLMAQGLSLAGALCVAAMASAAIPGESAEMAGLRAAAGQRPRRIVYNDDGCGPIWKPQGDTAERFWNGPHGRMKAVPGTQVDSVFICSGATHVLNHTSAVAESYADIVDRYGVTAGGFDHFRDNMRALEALGTDAIRLTADFCRQRSVEVFYTYRVNDLHLAQGGSMNVERSTWWREHPEYWLGAVADIAEEGMGKYPATDPRHWGWASLNFEMPQVRAYLLSILEDVAGRYDLDGLEIDFIRAPLLFRPNLEGKPATAAQRDILTGFMHQVRLIAVRASMKRNRPMLVSARVPATVSRCRYIGIDIEPWLAAGHLDMMSLGGGYVPFTSDWKEMVDLGHRHGVPVYPVISASGMRGPYAAIEAWRGAAMNIWQSGADGVYLFNHAPNAPSPQFKQLGDPSALATMDKIFAVENNPSGYWGHYVCLLDSSADADDPGRYGADIGTMPTSRLLPMTVAPAGDGAFVLLPIGDDIAAAAADGALRSAVLKVQLSAPGDVQVALNGQPLTATDENGQDGWLTFAPRSSSYAVGPNEVAFRLAGPRAEGADPVRVLAVEVHVKYR